MQGCRVAGLLEPQVSRVDLVTAQPALDGNGDGDGGHLVRGRGRDRDRGRARAWG